MTCRVMSRSKLNKGNLNEYQKSEILITLIQPNNALSLLIGIYTPRHSHDMVLKNEFSMLNLSTTRLVLVIKSCH